MKVAAYQEWIDRWFGGGLPSSRQKPDPDLLKSDPLRVDLATQSLRPPHKLSLVAKNPPLQERFGSPHPQGYYLYSLRLPEGLFSAEQVRELSTWIRSLNFYLKEPIDDFVWNQSDCGHYLAASHHVRLRPEWQLEPGQRVEATKATLTHEMMHGLFNGLGLAEDKGWRSIYHLSLARRSYEIFDDSNYLPERPDYYGHPYDNSNEAFASAATAYYFKADLMAAYLRHPSTPEAMKLVGKAAWCFLRDRIFGGEVFTSDRIDPWAGERLEGLLEEVAEAEKDSLWAAYLSSEPKVRELARQGLAEGLDSFKADLPFHLLDILEEGGAEASEAALRDLLEEHYTEAAEDILSVCLKTALDGEDAGARRSAVEALGLLRDKSSAIDNRIALTLIEALNDPDARVQSAAETTLRNRRWLDLQSEVDRALSQCPPGPAEALNAWLQGFWRWRNPT